MAAGLAAVALHGIAHAESEWATRGELGLVMAHGNTDSQSGNVKFDTAHAVGRWKYSLGGSALYARSNDIETAQRWDARFQTDLKLSERAYWFGALRYEDDRFSGFVYQGSFSSGAGYDFIVSEKTKLSGQLGLGVRQLRPELLIRDEDDAVIDRVPQERHTDMVASGGLHFEHSFSTSTKVVDSFLVESGQSNTLTKNNLSLQVQMNSKLALALGYQVNRNSSPPPGTRSTDTLLTVNLVYELKNPKLSPTTTAAR